MNECASERIGVKRTSDILQGENSEAARPKQSKIVRRGGIEFRNRNFALPSGPSNLEELMKWPATIVEELIKDPSRKERFFNICKQGFNVGTSYSGLDAPREALTQICHYLQAEYGVWPRLSFSHACDIAPVPQYVLVELARREDLSASCVFGDLESRLSLEARAKLDELNPEKNASPEAKAQSYQSMWKYLRDNRSALYNAWTTSHCLVHKRECRIMGDSSTPEDSQDTIALSPSAGLPKPLQMHVAGTVCKGWSLAGGRAMFSHESERTHAVWLAERLSMAEQNLEDLFFQECTVKYAVDEKLREPLADTHRILAIKTGPEVQGWPISRPRSFTAALNLNRLVPQGCFKFIVLLH